jgi:glycosyltransferase involved in cell wall biosynthesis
MSIPATAEFDPREAGAPADWPRSNNPMTIAILGWARLCYQATQGSGYNLSASELASGLAMSGHAVYYLASGRKYNLVPWPYIARTERWRGIECYDLVNSPNLSPASYNFANMPKETRCPSQTGRVLSWLERMKVDVVHVHSLEGFSLDLVATVRKRMPVVVTPHNYWYACPQVDLMYKERELCMDYHGGERCSGCLKRKSPAAHRLKRRMGQSVEWVVGQEATGAGRLLGKALAKRWRSLSRRAWGRSLSEPLPNSRLPDPEIAAGLLSRASAPSDGLVRVNLARESTDGVRFPVGRVPLDANEQFLRAAHHLTVLNDYGRRRVDGVESLGAASIVTPPSDFMRRTYIRMGLPEEKVRVVRLGQPHFDVINRRARRSASYGQRPWAPSEARPLRLGFLGAMRPSKGIDVLADAIARLPHSVRRRCQFHIRAQGFDWPLRKRLAVFPEVAFNGGYDLLQLVAEGGEYDVGILPHVWLENSPLVLLEHLHAGKFVICSRLGGVVEWVDPPRNGLFFSGGHPEDLASCVERLVSGEVVIPSPREIHDATPLLRSYPDHVAEVESVYRELLESGAVPPTPEISVPRPAQAEQPVS